jgi:dephospho-CoA kinase
MRVVGLTGGIGSGKTTAAIHLAELGAVVLDVDKVAHSTYRRGEPAFDKLVAAFGPEIVGEDGEIDRRQLGTTVFAAPAELKKLTDVVWPATYTAAHAQVREERERGTAVVVVEAAVLFEAGWNDIADEIWVVVTSPHNAINRIIARNGLSQEQAQERIAAQLSNEERVARADVVITNDGTVDDLLARVDQCWAELQSRLATPAI